MANLPKIGSYLLKASSLLTLLSLLFFLSIYFREIFAWVNLRSYLIENGHTHYMLWWVLFFISTFIIAPVCAMIGGGLYLSDLKSKSKIVFILLPLLILIPGYYYLRIMIMEIFPAYDQYTTPAIFLFIMPFPPVMMYLFIDLILNKGGRRRGKRWLIGFILSITLLYSYIVFTENEEFYLEELGEGLLVFLLFFIFIIGIDLFSGQWNALSKKPLPLNEKTDRFKLGLIDWGLRGEDTDVFRLILAGFVLSGAGLSFMFLILIFIRNDIDMWFSVETAFALLLVPAILFLLIPSRFMLFRNRRRFRKEPGSFFGTDMAELTNVPVPKFSLKRILKEQERRSEIFSLGTYERWTFRTIICITTLLSIHMIDLSLMGSRYFQTWGPYTEIGIYGAWILFVLILYPYTILYLIINKNQGKKNIIPTISIVSSLLFLTLIVNGVIGPYTQDNWGEYLWLDFEKSWMLFLIFPFITAMAYPVRDKFFTKRRIFDIVSTSLLSLAGIIIIFNTIKDPDFVSEGFLDEVLVYSIFSLPLIMALMISFRDPLKGSDRDMGKWLMKIGRSSKRLMFTGAPILAIMVIFPVYLEVHTAYDSWHDYRFSETFPEGEDGVFAREYLDRDLEIYLNEDRYEYGSLMDPNIATIQVFDDLKNWIDENEEEGHWGDFWADIEVEVYRENRIEVEHNWTEDQYWGYGIQPDTRINIIGPDQDYFDPYWEPYNSLIYIDTGSDDLIMNSTGYWGPWKASNITWTADGVDIIMVWMGFGSQTGPLCGYGGSLSQYIGVKNDEIIFIHSQRYNWIS